MKNAFLEKLTLHARHSLREAGEIALYSGKKEIAPEHLLLSLFMEEGGLSSLILENAGFKKETLGKLCLPKGKAPSKKTNHSSKKSADFSPSMKKIIVRAFSLAEKHHSPYVGTEHFATALAESKDASVREIFLAFGIEQSKTLSSIQSHLNFEHLPPLSKMFNLPEISLSKKASRKKNATPFLDQYAIDLGSRYEDEPFTGRSQEKERIAHILGRKHKNNPLLIGEPGVGKTALVSALARNIRSGQSYPFLEGKRILALDLALVVAGTSFRGEFEARLKEILKEATNDPSVILFIDEIHTLVGAGNTSGGLDAANILKPALARGDIRCIGATTFVEYKRHIEKDPALDRRFQSVSVREPSPEETLHILEDSKSSFEQFHGVTISPEAIRSSIDLSVRFINDRFLPDKAFDILDEAASSLKHRATTISRYPSELSRLQSEYEKIIAKKNAAIEKEQYSEAALLKKDEQTIEKSILRISKESLKKESRSEKNTPLVTEEHIRSVIARVAGIPEEKISPNERKDFLSKAPAILRETISGQDEAITAVSQALIRSSAGTNDPNRPIASFLFLGPSGVGKTLLAKTIAERFFGSEKSLIRIDMSEFGERHNVAQMIGSPAGYIGYGEGGKLTEKIRRSPYSVVLFDEIEKAHPDVGNILLSILEDGSLTDAEGRTSSFKHAIIILTSNIGTHAFGGSKIGFDRSHKKEVFRSEVLDELKRSLRPELISRLGDIIVFNPIDKKSYQQIIHLELEKLKKRLEQKNIVLSIEKAVIEKLTPEEISPADGARPIRKKIEQEIEQPIAEFLLAHPKKKNIVLTIKNGKIIAKAHAK